MKVVVIGSSNIDMVAQVSHLPAPGETVGDANFMQSLGGKGANQAVAAARLGGSVTFVTSLGNDMYADIVSIRPRACFFPLFSFLPLWLHYNLNPLCVQY